MAADQFNTEEMLQAIYEKLEKGATVQLLNQTEAAGILGVKPQTLSVWRTQGRGPKYVKLNGSAVRYVPTSLVDYIQKSTVTV